MIKLTQKLKLQLKEGTQNILDAITQVNVKLL